MRSTNYKLQFITHRNDRYTHIDSARLALEGGCRWVQLRMKGADYNPLILEDTAIVIRDMCRSYGATFIVDDDVLLAKRIGADGVHLGKGDMPLNKARAILGSDAIIGATVNSFEDILLCLRRATPDYFGCGPYRFTTTKESLSPILGLDGYREIIAKMQSACITTPIVAIGGITDDDITPLTECGIDGIALSSSVLNDHNPIEYMKKIVDTVYLSKSR